MKKRGVIFKLFAITALFFLLFYAIIMLGQLLFFEKFYQQKKGADLERKLKAFEQYYVTQQWDDKRMSREIALFMTHNKSQLAILNPDGKVKYDNPFRIVVQEEDGHSVKISLSLFNHSDLENLWNANLTLGDKIEAEGLYEDETNDFLFPLVIKKPGVKDIGTLKGIEEPEELDRVSGTITDLLLPGPNQWNLRQGLLFLALDEWFPLSEAHAARLHNGHILSAEWTEPWTGIRSLIAIQPVMRDGQVSELIMALTSLQQISEANDALQLFYVYIGIGGFALILLLSLIFSKIVSKPLLSLNRIALRMAKLDFSVKSPIRSNDEFGSLSDSLNSLSEKLDDTLKQLQETNHQLQEEMEQKQRIERMQKEFMSNTSHELKTPLSIVKGFAEGLKDGVGENKRERYIEVILDETGKMENLVKDMLELTKLETKTIRLRKTSFCVSELMEEIVDKLSHHLNEKQLKVVTVTASEPVVYADQEKIEQVIFNILMNAIRYATAGNEITVRIDNEEDKMRMSIENEGEPIPEDQLEHVWERFYRAERSRNRKTGGTGLGLAIVKHILELHESEYGVANTKRGVAFYFVL
ncbi:cell wall metabolism sensor histidine kinase WalK [Paenibacillus sp. J2TS4]|uniref:sensor histidine kinase n=1 Tax=Paenibacillus sp. J2TS4 TaxID=2807194 RepID=UPI001B05CA2C|nr:sensor histidine kinase [Paenibacillus sp. J2TS4]GIP32126.1 two-component sensor histidine kinase [Paenibacillus sp. J2TS4]